MVSADNHAWWSLRVGANPLSSSGPQGWLILSPRPGEGHPELATRPNLADRAIPFLLICEGEHYAA